MTPDEARARLGPDKVEQIRQMLADLPPSDARQTPVPRAYTLTGLDLRNKMTTARRHHAERYRLRHNADPTRPLYTRQDLQHRCGWQVEPMINLWNAAIMGRCPCGQSNCGRPLLDIPPQQISIDVINPDLPPVWEVNTQFMYIGCNSSKQAKSHAERIQQRMDELTAPTTQPKWTQLGLWTT